MTFLATSKILWCWVKWLHLVPQKFCDIEWDDTAYFLQNQLWSLVEWLFCFLMNIWFMISLNLSIQIELVGRINTTVKSTIKLITPIIPCECLKHGIIWKSWHWVKWRHLPPPKSLCIINWNDSTITVYKHYDTEWNDATCLLQKVYVSLIEMTLL